MATIKDYFTVIVSTTPNVATPRVTHGTTCYMYTYGCCSCCCICIPQASSSSQRWTYEMWGQGGGGAAGCCCYYSPQGGGGGQYGAARQSRRTDSYLGIRLCACSCWCCCYNGMNGHPGQFSSICEIATIGWTMSSGGGVQGCVCCFYLWNYPYDCNLDKAVYNVGSMKSSGSSSLSVACRMQDLYSPDNVNGNACGSMQDPVVCLPIIQAQGAVAEVQVGVPIPGSYSVASCYYISGSCCQCGTHTGTIWNCNPTECYSWNGSCGYANGALGASGICSNAYIGLGIGGSSWAGGNAQPYHSCSNSWTWGGCMGVVPGGGGSSSGGCAGDCCYGSVGGAGLVIVSYDN